MNAIILQLVTFHLRPDNEMSLHPKSLCLFEWITIALSSMFLRRRIIW